MKKLLMIVMTLAAGMAAWGDEAAFARATGASMRLDTRTGTRIAAKGASETIAYSPKWGGATSCTVTADGATLKTASAEGEVAWSPATTGAHTLTHTAGSVAYTAQFTVLGDDVTQHAGALAASETWASNTVHLVTADVTVPSGKTLTIEPGAVVKFMTGTSLTIGSGGICYARGVIFTHINDDTVGGDTLMDGDAAKPVVDGYDLIYNGQFWEDDDTQYRYMKPVVLASSVTSNMRLKGHTVYKVSTSTTIASGATLTVPPGVIFKFASGCSMIVQGTLNAQGTRSEPIVFTSLNDDDWGGDTNGDGDATYAQPGDWHQIAGSGTVKMDYCQMLWCSAQNNQGALYPTGGTWSFDNSIVAHCQYDCMRGAGGNFTAENSIFADSSMGVAPQNGSSKFVNCVFYYLTTAVRWGCGSYYNCIFANITTDVIDTKFYSSTVNSPFSHCCFWAPAATGDKASAKVGSNGNIWADPLFLDPDNGDFRIADDSPCVDAGDGTVAPEVDYWNRPRMNVTQVAKKGVADAEGQYPDIGIYEVDGVMVKATPDLVADQVTVPAALTVGAEAEISWRVENRGAVAADGVWQDRLEFVGDNGAAVTLATFADYGPLAASNAVVRTAAFTVPALPLKGRVRVVVNADRNIYETITANNAAEAAGMTTVSYPALAVAGGASCEVTLPEEGTVGFALPSGFVAGGLLVVRSAGPVEARLAKGMMPTADIFAAEAVKAADGVWILRIPAGGETAYATFATPSGRETTAEVSALAGDLLLFDGGVLAASNAGVVTVPFYGNGFDETMAVMLEKDGRQIASGDLSVKSAVEATAVFDVTGAASGVWTLVVTKGGRTVRCERVELSATAMGPKWTCRIDAASSVRAGRIYTGAIVYANTGDTAMAAPYVHVTSKNGTQIRFSTADAWTDSLELMATSESYPASRLKPGEEVRVTFYYQTTGSGVSIQVASATNDPKDFPWETNGSYMRPSWATDEIWSRAFAILKRNVGATWNDCFDRMNADADHLMKIGTPERRFDKLWQLEVNEALGVDHAVGSLAGGTDLARSGRGFGLSFSRSYGSGMSQRLRKGVLGYGWSDNLSVSCELQENDTRFVIQSGNGASYAFTKLTGTWAPEDARDKTVMTETSAEWVLTARSGMVVRFSKAKKRMVSIRDNMGNGIDFTHDASGNVTEVKHTDGQWLRFTYAGGLLVSAADDQGRTATYAYTGEMLTEVTAFNGRKVRYNYLPADETATSRALRQIVAADGQTKDFTYDEAGRIATASRNGTHFTSEIVRGELGSYAIVAPNGGVTEVTIGASGETLSTVNALGQKVTRTYTADTLLESVVSPTGKRSKIFYDTNGQAVKSMDAAGATTSFAYTPDFGSLMSVTDARQNAVTYGYDKLGRSESVAYPDETSSRISYATNGDVTNAVNAKGECIVYAYDKEGNKVSATWPNGRAFAWTYDAKGNCTRASDSVTGTVTMEYDDQEQLTRISYPGNRGFTYAYDAYGRVTARTSLDGAAQKYEYDAFGRLAKMTDGAGNPYVTNTYDPVTGNLVLQTYGNGTVVSNAYDVLGRTIGIYHLVGSAPRADRLAFFEYAYNEDGQRISLTTKEGVERYTYDVTGQVIGVVYPDGTEENFTYDAVGNRLTTSDETYTVNALNQYTSVGAAPRADRDSTFTYDLDGNLTSRTSAADGTTTYTYDCESRLVGVTNTLKGIAWSCEYDVFGNRVRVTDNGVTTEKLYIQGSLPSVAAEYVNGTLTTRHILSGAVRIADETAGEVRYYHADGLASTRLVTDSNGAVVSTASYKAFGEIRTAIGTAIADGYVGTLGVERDSTGLLFMRNRYYDAAMGRFVQRDPIGLDAGDENWYRYCGNNPLCAVDPKGLFVPVAIAICMAANPYIDTAIIWGTSATLAYITAKLLQNARDTMLLDSIEGLNGGTNGGMNPNPNLNQGGNGSAKPPKKPQETKQKTDESVFEKSEFNKGTGDTPNQLNGKYQGTRGTRLDTNNLWK